MPHRSKPSSSDDTAAAGYAVAPLPDDEARRLAALQAYGVLDTDAEQSFDDLTRLAAQLCRTPVALLTLVDSRRQWFKARFGLDATQTPRDVAFCAHALLAPEEVFVVEDALADERFAGNPLVAEAPHLRFYAGAPLVTPDGHALGTLCVVDHVPRRLADDERRALKALARQAIGALELRRLQIAAVPGASVDGLQLHLRRLWPAARPSREPIAVALLAADGAATLPAEPPAGLLRRQDQVLALADGTLALLMPRADTMQAFGAADRLRAAAPVPASAGVAAVRPDADAGPNELVAQARAALHAARAAGGSRTQVFVGRVA